jgi:mono/diheme cytochrome c family protein
VIALTTAAFGLRLVMSPGPMDFAGGKRGAPGSSSSSVPTELANASLIQRGEYLTRAADCQAAVHGALYMPDFGSAYPDTEIAAVANYVTARFGSAPSNLTAANVADLRREIGK